MSMTFNTTQFNNVLAQVFEHSERTYPDFINGQGLRLASFAVQETERAEAALIAAKLGQVATRIANKRTGGMLARRKGRTPGQRVFTSAASVDLYRIVNWRRARQGKAPIAGKLMSKAARKLRGAALRSTGFIAAGWIYAVKGLSALRYGNRGVKWSLPNKVSGKPKGFVNPARSAINSWVTCEMGNTSLLAQSAYRTGSRKGNPMPVAVRGLQRAMVLTAEDMLNHLAEKLNPTFKKFSA